MLLFLTIAGGVALILFGVRFLRKGLDRLLGPQIGEVMQRLTPSRVHAFFVGVGVSLAAPSSTTVSILAVQAVQAGHLPGHRMLAVMLGANVGLTTMVLLIALRLEQYAPVLILVGVGLFQFTQRSGTRGVGQVVLSLGLIFTAIGTLKGAAGAFDPSGDFARLLEIAAHYPAWMVVIAAALTVGLQSSTAAIALVIGLGAAGAVTLPLALAVVVGANVGLGLSTLLVGWGQVESRRLALGNLVTKGAGAVAALALLPWAVEAVTRLPVGLDQQVALAHTGFNAVVAAVSLPLITPLYRVAVWLAPEPAEGGGTKPFGPQYLTPEPMEGLSLAAGQSRRELLRMSELVRAMLADLWRAVERFDMDLAKAVQQRDDEVDLLDEAIKQFLAKVAARADEPDEAGEILRQLRFLSELETIGDVIDKNLADLAIKRARFQVMFTPEGWAELEAFHRKVAENLLIAETVFATRDVGLAEKLLRHKGQLDRHERELRDRHFARLKSGLPQTHASSAIHLDLLTHLRRINTCAAQVAYTIIPNDAYEQTPA